MRISEFIQLFSQRKQNLAWFLGAGASASGGIPTAGEMIWDFKRQIYCAEQKVHITQFGDLSDPDVRRRLQTYFVSKGTFPLLDSIDEYAFYFEYFLGDEGDRRRYIEGLIGRGKTFIEFVEQLEREEDLQLETFEVGKDKVVIVTIEPDKKKKDKDILIPVLSPILTRKKSLADEISDLDVSSFNCPLLPRKQDDVAAKNFHYEGYDLITLQKLIEREYTIPEPQTAEEVIGYYARRIAQEVKLPSQFSVLVPKVREFLESKAFGEKVDLSVPVMVKATFVAGAFGVI